MFPGITDIQKTKIMASGPITSWQIVGGKMETGADFIFLGSKITADSDFSQEIKKTLAPWKKSYDKPAAAAAKSLRSCPTVQPHRWQPTTLLHPWDSPGKNTGVGCHFLLHDKPIQCIKKQRHHFAGKGPYSLSYGFSSSHVWM